MNISIKRLMKDRKSMEKDRDILTQEGIYFNWDDDNIYHCCCMIIGPRDTPYEGGFYFFDIKFPNNFPFAPPKVDFKSIDNKVRFNPNLYAQGKVCLSLLGTWSGEPWSSVFSLRTVLIALLPVLNDNPIRNEPGFEKENKNGYKAITYNKMIEFANFRLGILEMLENPPKNFEVFVPIMKDCILKNKKFYLNKLRELKEKYKKRIKIKAPIYNWYETIDYNKIYILFTKYIKKNLNIDVDNLDDIPEKKKKEKITKTIINILDSIDNSDSIENIIVSSSNNKTSESSEIIKKKKPKKKYTRKAPNELAKKYDLGFIKESSNNNNQKYIVVENKNGIKRWKKYNLNKK